MQSDVGGSLSATGGLGDSHGESQPTAFGGVTKRDKCNSLHVIERFVGDA